MNNGLTKERITIFEDGGKTALQGYNDKIAKCGKIFLYFRIDGKYICANDFRVDFEINEQSLRDFAKLKRG